MAEEQSRPARRNQATTQGPVGRGDERRLDAARRSRLAVSYRERETWQVYLIGTTTESVRVVRTQQATVEVYVDDGPRRGSASVSFLPGDRGSFRRRAGRGRRAERPAGVQSSVAAARSVRVSRRGNRRYRHLRRAAPHPHGPARPRPPGHVRRARLRALEPGAVPQPRRSAVSEQPRGHRRVPRDGGVPGHGGAGQRRQAYGRKPHGPARARHRAVDVAGAVATGRVCARWPSRAAARHAARAGNFAGARCATSSVPLSRTPVPSSAVQQSSRLQTGRAIWGEHPGTGRGADAGRRPDVAAGPGLGPVRHGGPAGAAHRDRARWRADHALG